MIQMRKTSSKAKCPPEAGLRFGLVRAPPSHSPVQLPIRNGGFRRLTRASPQTPSRYPGQSPPTPELKAALTTPWSEPVEQGEKLPRIITPKACKQAHRRCGTHNHDRDGPPVTQNSKGDTRTFESPSDRTAREVDPVELVAVVALVHGGPIVPNVNRSREVCHYKIPLGLQSVRRNGSLCYGATNSSVPSSAASL